MTASSCSLYCVIPAAPAMRTLRRRAKPSKAGSSRAVRNLAHAVGPEIEAENAVTVSHAAIIADDCRYDEFIADLAPIGVGNDCACARETRPLGLPIA